MKHRKRRSASRRRRAERRAITAVCVVLSVIILALGSYAAGWYMNRTRIRRDADRYRALYDPERTEAASDTPASATPAPSDTPAPSEAPTPLRSDSLTPVPSDTPAPVPSDTPAPSGEAPGPADVPAVVDVPRATPNADTIVIALPTAPPVQASFDSLIAHNADTVGYLDIDGMLSLPVVHRENDNDYYLDHNFDGETASEGALFLDGTNRLVPEDDCLIVYGHNMKNDTMFGSLDAFESLAFLRTHAAVRFDTIYENRLYVPFAAFAASTVPGDRQYFDVRRFIFDEAEFELFAMKLKARSVRDIPVDVRYGDRLLLLVTCDYTANQGRFILALRQLRDGENAADARAMLARAS